MAANESFDILAFRSRQHALHFSEILKNYGYSSQLMSTPKEVALGCGLSLRFSSHLTANVIKIYKKYQLPIIGFYHVQRVGGSSQLMRIPHETMQEL